MSTYKILKKYNILIVLTIIILFSLLIIYLKDLNKKSASYFEDTPPETTQSAEDIVNASYGADGPPKMGVAKTCSSNADLVSMCIDYDNCCASMTENNKCFCANPFTQSCKNKYDACMNDPTNQSMYPSKQQITDKCSTDNKECCSKYNDKQFKSSNFTQQKNRSQNDNIICSMSSIKNIESRCMELCQTNSECVAYSSNTMKCNLYNKLSPFTEKLDEYGKPVANTSIKFYTKN